MAVQVAVLVHRAALDGHLLAAERPERGFQAGRTIDDDEVRLPQTLRASRSGTVQLLL